IQGTLDPRLVPKPDGRGGVIRGATRQRDEKLPPIDDIAAIYLLRGGAEAPAADAELRIGLALLHRLAVGLSIKGAFLHDLMELDGPELLVALTHRGKHRHVIGNRAHHQHGEAMHVEGECRRGVALRQLLRHQAVGFVIGPEPTVAFGHAQAEEPLGPEIGVVVEGKRRVAVVAVGARGEALAGQTAAKADQLALPEGRLEVHRRASMSAARTHVKRRPCSCIMSGGKEARDMGLPRKYAIIDPATGKLDRRIFSDQVVYDDEMERIFGRAWLMIGHESLVPAADDFFHTYMGEDPVILTRDGQGRLHALLNMCRHRGNRVCRVDDGNAKRFMCTYHGWTYRNDGALDHVPGESEAYYDALDRSSLGLIEARVETYAGIVFATWAKDAPSLETYLGDARWYLDTVFNRRDGGMQALGPMKWLEPVNWKTLVDNCSDNYHVPTSHLSSAQVQTRYLGRPRLSH